MPSSIEIATKAEWTCVRHSLSVANQASMMPVDYTVSDVGSLSSKATQFHVGHPTVSTSEGIRKWIVFTSGNTAHRRDTASPLKVV